MNERTNKIMECMTKRGYTVIMRSGDGKRIVFARTDNYTTPHTVEVFIESEEFCATYTVPQSCNILTTNKCGEVLDDTQFDRVMLKFKEQIGLLHKAFDLDSKCGTCKLCKNNECDNSKSIYYGKGVEKTMSCSEYRRFC